MTIKCGLDNSFYSSKIDKCTICDLCELGTQF